VKNDNFDQVKFDQVIVCLENNVKNLATENSEAETARKRKLEFENSVIDKKFRDQDDEDD
jgi:hypothetical protein